MGLGMLGAGSAAGFLASRTGGDSGMTKARYRDVGDYVYKLSGVTLEVRVDEEEVEQALRREGLEDTEKNREAIVIGIGQGRINSAVSGMVGVPEQRVGRIIARGSR